MRLLRITTSLLFLLILAVFATACGSDDDTGSRDTKQPSSTTKTATGAGTTPTGIEAKLMIAMNKVGGKGSALPIPAGLACTRSIPASCRGEITCPVADDATDIERDVCEFLSGAGGDALRATPAADEVCTEIYGGDETATVKGTLNGETINASFSRTNGCEIARFDAATPLWSGVAPGGAATITPSGDSSGSAPTSAPPTTPEIISDPPEAFQGK